MSDQVQQVGDSDFEAQVLKSDTPVLVDFWAPWCGPCKMIGPLVDELAGSYAGKVKVVKLNIDDNQTSPRNYAVRGIPTLILFKDGKPFGTQIGAPGDIKQRLVKLIESGL
ncbi:MAG TPA: thioredoxin [Arenimonas sp.]|uniref:thioredoxin n=1 Tax=Arenimonas sp. TaxID=1872635 RepID=UPI002C2D1C70|nr:thioredoxin [Arenimonas sp.]HMB56252.1 thioredoxin [Arenimonas sp.]